MDGMQRTRSNSSVGFAEDTVFANNQLATYVGVGASPGDDTRYSRASYEVLGLVPEAVLGMSPRPRIRGNERPTGNAYICAAIGDAPVEPMEVEAEDDPEVPNGQRGTQRVSEITTSAGIKKAIDTITKRIATAKDELGVDGFRSDSIRARTEKLQHNKRDVMKSKLVSDGFIKELVYLFEDEQSVDFLIELLEEMRWEFFERPQEVAALWRTIRDSEMLIHALRARRDEVSTNEERKKAKDKKEKLKRQLEQAVQEEQRLGDGASSEQIEISDDDDDDDDDDATSPKSRLQRTPVKQKKSMYKDDSDDEWDGESKGKGKGKRRRR